LRRPEEIDPVQKSKKQGRIAERRQRAADVRHKKDEKHDDVGVEAAPFIGASRRTALGWPP
jgi:hypothetical protein